MSLNRDSSLLVSAMMNHLYSLSTTPTFRSNSLKEIQPNTYYLHNSYIHNDRIKGSLSRIRRTLNLDYLCLCPGCYCATCTYVPLTASNLIWRVSVSGTVTCWRSLWRNRWPVCWRRSNICACLWKNETMRFSTGKVDRTGTITGIPEHK